MKKSMANDVIFAVLRTAVKVETALSAKNPVLAFAQRKLSQVVKTLS